jgi:hypothetical protein
MELIGLLGTSVGLGIGAGVNAYATLLVFGLFARFNPAWFPGDSAQFFASTPVLVGLGVLYLIEFVADKVPAIDHVWDVIHTFIRPAAGAVVALSAANADLPHHYAVIASVLAGGAALTSHLGKAGLRAASTASTGGVANPFLSLIEDVFAVLGAILSIFLPWLVLFFGVLFLIALMFYLRGRNRRVAAAG